MLKTLPFQAEWGDLLGVTWECPRREGEARLYWGNFSWIDWKDLRGRNIPEYLKAPIILVIYSLIFINNSLYVLFYVCVKQGSEFLNVLEQGSGFLNVQVWSSHWFFSFSLIHLRTGGGELIHPWCCNLSILSLPPSFLPLFLFLFCLPFISIFITLWCIPIFSGCASWKNYSLGSQWTKTDEATPWFPGIASMQMPCSEMGFLLRQEVENLLCPSNSALRNS